MTTWLDQAACKGQTDRMFLAVFEELAKRTCAVCPVRDRCLADCLAIENPYSALYGVVGGLNPKERQAAWRRLRRPRSAAAVNPGRPRKPIAHGSERGYYQHTEQGVPACVACLDARQRARKARKNT